MFKISNQHAFRALGPASFTTIIYYVFFFSLSRHPHRESLRSPFPLLRAPTLPTPNHLCSPYPSVTSSRSPCGKVTAQLELEDGLGRSHWMPIPFLVAVWRISVSKTLLGFDQNKKSIRNSHPELICIF